MISRRDCLVRIAVLVLAPLGLSRARAVPAEAVLCDEAGFPFVTETGELIGC